ncbi:MAG: LysM peptidoglycan-binding domain-containing protein [Deltaproteobacteria bacterium]|nr:MAG: LysM peptidoglycan-binding domain-containing protein [Deltaproteobacteria bacterium]
MIGTMPPVRRRGDSHRRSPTGRVAVWACLVLVSAGSRPGPGAGRAVPVKGPPTGTPRAAKPASTEGACRALAAATDRPDARVSDGAATGPVAASLPVAAIRWPRKRWIRHTVVPRETFAGIAARYRVRPASLRRWNPELGDEVRKGEVLRIYTDFVPPPRRPIEVTVAEGDTWWSIACRHGVGSWDLRAMNYRPGGRLRPGETLRIWIDPIAHDFIEREWADPPFGVRPGAHGVGSPDDGRLVCGVQLPERPEYIRKIPGSAYGTTHTVRNLIAAMVEFRRRSGYGGRVYIGAISRPRGGRLGGHKSHRTGRDVDIRLPLKESIPQALEPRPARRVDFRALYHLIRALVDTGEVEVVFLDYPLQRRLAKAAAAAGASEAELAALLQWPRGRKASRGIVRDEPGHDDHIHVRFRCGPGETECYSRTDEGWGRIPEVRRAPGQP